MDVADFFELQRAFQGGGEVVLPAQIEEVSAVLIGLREMAKVVTQTEGLLDLARKRVERGDDLPALEDGQTSSAFDELAQAIEIDPFNGESYLVRARLWASLGDSQRAISDAGRAIRFGLDAGDRREAIALMIRLRSGLR